MEVGKQGGGYRINTLALVNNEPMINHLVTTKSSQYIVRQYAAEYGNAVPQRVAERSSAERSPRLSQHRAWLRIESWSVLGVQATVSLDIVVTNRKAWCEKSDASKLWLNIWFPINNAFVDILHQTKSGIVTILVDPPSTDMFYLSLPSFVLSTFSRSLRDTHVN